MNYTPKFELGDCLDVLKSDCSNDVFDLIMTSPPYADARKDTYGGVAPDKYLEWFLPRSAEFYRVLAPQGSFILNIKEKVVDGERHTYVLELIMAMRKQGWLWVEEYIWTKPNPMPGKWPNRFRDGWERCLHFTKSKEFKMLQDSVMEPIKDSSRKRIKNLNTGNDMSRQTMRTKSGFGMNKSNMVGRELAYPSNVLHMSCETGNKRHSAAFPSTLPAWFIKLFTIPGDFVLDPFSGSGTTCKTAEALQRYSVGIEILENQP